MALSAASSLSSKPFLSTHPLTPSSSSQDAPALLHLHSPSPSPSAAPLSVTAVHAADPSKKPAAVSSLAVPSPSKWSVDSWKSKKALQLPEYPNKDDLETVLKTIESFPPIVFAGEARSLEERLADAAVGKAFLLQGGDCAESFKEFNANNIRDTFRILLQMSVVMMFGGQMPVIKVGRMAGQFAKPRSDPFEEKDGVKLPSYRGDNINGDVFDEKSRIPDPQRMIRAYCQAAATLNLLRAFATGGYAAMQRVTQWNLDFTENSEQGDRYRELAHRVDEALGFMAAAGLTIEHPIMTTTDFWTSHECLLLPYEQALTREDSTTGLYYDCSAHMLWVGERTRQLDGAHVEFLRGVANPLGIKVSDKMDPKELVKLIEILNPQNKAGRITIITRMGAENMKVKLPHLIRAVRGAGQVVTWVSDPMHGNTIKAPCGLKTHPFDAIWYLQEFPANTPLYKDWREHQVLNEVRNQGRCNCCWAIAACTVIAALLKIKEKSIELVLLSPQDLINCNEPKKESDYDSCRCYAFTVNKAFRYIMKNGVRYERDCEFQGKRGVCLPHDEFTETVKIGRFTRIDDGDEKKLLEVVSRHPVAAAVKVSEQLKNLKEEIYVGPAPYIDTDTLPAHTVVIVGYGHEERMRMNYWIVMSSWGKKWGSGGFGRIARDSSLPPGSKPLLFRASFPLVD